MTIDEINQMRDALATMIQDGIAEIQKHGVRVDNVYLVRDPFTQPLEVESVDIRMTLPQKFHSSNSHPDG